MNDSTKTTKTTTTTKKTNGAKPAEGSQAAQVDASAAMAQTVILNDYPMGTPLDKATADRLQKVVGTGQIVRIPLGMVSVARGFNIRDFSDNLNKVGLEALEGQVREHGSISKPTEGHLVQTEDGLRYVLSDGERRTRAVTKLAQENNSGLWADMPVLVLKGEAPTGAARLTGYVTANSGMPPTVLEKAYIALGLRAEGYPDGYTATVLGASRPYVIQTLYPLEYATPAMKDLVRLGKAPGGITGSYLSDRIVAAIKTLPKGMESSEEDIAITMTDLEKRLLEASNASKRRAERGENPGRTKTADGASAVITDYTNQVAAYGTSTSEAQKTLVDGIREALTAKTLPEAVAVLTTTLTAIGVPVVKPEPKETTKDALKRERAEKRTAEAAKATAAKAAQAAPATPAPATATA